MKRMRVVLNFGPDMVEKPVTYHLITDYAIRVNILRASIDPGKQGKMVVDLEGEDKNLSHGLNFLAGEGVSVAPLSREIQHLQDRCTSCTACIPHCPTGALSVDRRDWTVSFDPEACVVCLSCVDVCIYRAMAVTDGLEMVA